MSEPKAIYIPQLNPNEIEVRLASLSIYNGKAIKNGDILATFETTKSTSELLSDDNGFVIGLTLAEGDTAQSGDVFCFVSAEPTALPPAAVVSRESHDKTVKINPTGIPEGLRISKPALVLAQQNNLDLTSLPIGPLVTENEIRARLNTSPTPVEQAANTPHDPTALVIYGGGGHGKSLIDLVSRLGYYNLLGIIDDGLPQNTQIMGVPVLGGSEILGELASRGIHLAINAVGGIGNIRPRLTVFKKLADAGFICPIVIHPSAVVESSAALSGGSQVFPLAYVGSSVQLGFGVIANTGAIISHDCIIGHYANISPGAILAGGVTIGDRSLIGMGVTINLGVSIGSDVRVGNNATIKADVPSGIIVHAGSIWPPTH